MIGIKMTEYTFEIKRIIKVNVSGRDTDYNYEKARKEAVRQIQEEADDDWLENVEVNEYTDYEENYKAYKEAV